MGQTVGLHQLAALASRMPASTRAFSPRSRGKADYQPSAGPFPLTTVEDMLGKSTLLFDDIEDHLPDHKVARIIL